ncbi:MAG: FecR family protein [Pseudomonadota bacterium]|nr:FecR family protein [Pseudomonadota bacterium]
MVLVMALMSVLGTVPVAAQQRVLDVSRISGEADLIRSDRVASLRPSDTVQAGDEVRTGSGGHLGLQLPPVGQITLGRNSRLIVHSIEAIDPPARMGLARLVVHSGSMQLDSRGGSDLPPADIRLNVGTLRARIFGAAVWIDRGSAGDEVCLLGGAVELQGPSGPLRLEDVGSCVRATNSGVAVLDPNTAGPIAARLALTAFPGDPTDEARRADTVDDRLAFGYAAPPGLQAKADVAPAAAPKPAKTVAAETASSAPPPAAAGDTPRFTPYTSSATVSTDGEVRLTPAAWTIVLASVANAARANEEAARLRKTGIDAQVIESQSNGARTWRIVSGAYPGKQNAQADLRDIRKRRGLGEAWLTQLP